MKLLIVDNNPEMRRLIIRIAGKPSDAIFECADGAEALTAYRKHCPDWVLMDIEMPQTDGISATREIIAVFPNAKIAIVTDYDNANFRKAAIEAGACGYVVKENLVELRRLLAL